METKICQLFFAEAKKGIDKPRIPWYYIDTEINHPHKRKGEIARKYRTIYEIEYTCKEYGSSSAISGYRWARNKQEAERIERRIRLTSSHALVSIRKLDKSEHDGIRPEMIEG